jgi:hypothetical protein
VLRKKSECTQRGTGQIGRPSVPRLASFFLSVSSSTNTVHKDSANESTQTNHSRKKEVDSLISKINSDIHWPPKVMVRFIGGALHCGAQISIRGLNAMTDR